MNRSYYLFACISLFWPVLFLLSFSFPPAPPISVVVTANRNTPLMVGQTGDTLICGVSGAERLNPTIAYQWTRNDGTIQTQFGTNSNILSFSPVRLSDAGDYTCSATVGSTLLNNDITVFAGNAQTLVTQSE